MLLVVVVAFFLELAGAAEPSELRGSEGCGLEFGEEFGECFSCGLGGGRRVDVEGFAVRGSVFEGYESGDDVA